MFIKSRMSSALGATLKLIGSRTEETTTHPTGDSKCLRRVSGSSLKRIRQRHAKSDRKQGGRYEHEFPETETLRCTATDHAPGSNARLVCPSDRRSCCYLHRGSCQAFRQIRGAARRDYLHSCVSSLCTRTSLSVQKLVEGSWKLPCASLVSGPPLLSQVTAIGSKRPVGGARESCAR
jgi:hypothetical protein